MKLKFLLFVTAFAAVLQTQAQTWNVDSVEMGAGYANDIFYNISTGNEKVQAANDWDIAFQINKFGDPSFNASVRANHIKRKVEVYSLHMQATASTFQNLSASDTIGKTSRTMQLMNVDTSWGEGAFTQNRDLTDLFDFGWGKYQGAPNHDLLGDSIYLVKVNGPSGQVYKLWLQQYVSMVDSLIGYKFQIASFDGTTVNNTVYVKKKDYPDRLFVYYDIASNTFIDREPNRNNWDLLFTQYAKIAPNGGPIVGGFGTQAYTGVLSNLEVGVAEVKTSNPDGVQLSSVMSSFNDDINTIGDDWKTFNMSTFLYDLDTVTYFVKSKNAAKYYQLKFTRFDGASGGATGKIVFATKYLADVLTVNDVQSNISSYGISPNPAVGEANFVAEVKEAAQGRLLVTDITGKVMINSVVNLQKGINAFRINTSGFAAGTYIISLGNGSWKIADKLMVQH